MHRRVHSRRGTRTPRTKRGTARRRGHLSIAAFRYIDFSTHGVTEKRVLSHCSVRAERDQRVGQREVEDIRACRVRGARWRAKARARQLRLHRRNCAWSARDFRAQTASTEKMLSVALSAHSPPLRIIRHRAYGTLRLGKMQGLPRNISVIFQGSPPPPPLRENHSCDCATSAPGNFLDGHAHPSSSPKLP